MYMRSSKSIERIRKGRRPFCLNPLTPSTRSQYGLPAMRKSGAAWPPVAASGPVAVATEINITCVTHGPWY